ncbi:MAG: hypothetical protein IIC24_06245, partial [Chloroflexi bacterium]|nr:hypothetical protein [Chloroflexota bacterium]
MLISPTDSGYVEYDGAILSNGIAVPVKIGKFVNLVARPLNGDWIFARWERDLSGANANEALLMDESKIVRAVFVPVNPPTPTSTPTMPTVVTQTPVPNEPT